MTDHVHTCVIGAGAVGLAIARELSKHTGDIVVLEKRPTFGQGISSRSSEVIHAGIYYPAGSLKAKLCRRGALRLYAYCAENHIGHARCGKLIIANSLRESEALENVRQRAQSNGASDLEMWSKQQIQKQEPAVRASDALYSPTTGIVDSHELMRSFVTDIDKAGGQIAYQTEVLAITKKQDDFLVQTQFGGENYEFTCTNLINAAGLGAQTIANKCEFLNQVLIPELRYCKGSYYQYLGKNPFSHLIYPVPEASHVGLGVHATLDLAGQLKFGPDVEYIDVEDYTVASAIPSTYCDVIRRYYPALDTSKLVPAYAGIRPKISVNTPDQDFCIQSTEDHDVENLVQLFGIESPGLTASMAIGEYVADLLASS